MPLKLIQTVEPGTPVVTDTEQKLHARIDLDDDDLLVTSLNETATDYVSERLQRSFITDTWELSLDEFPSSPDPIKLFRAPILAISSIKYIDTDGVTQTLASSQYILDEKSEPGVIQRAHLVTWPTTRSIVNAVTVTFTVGYGDEITDVPEKFKTIIKHMFNHLYVHREPMKDKKWVEIPEHLNALLKKYDLRIFG